MFAILLGPRKGRTVPEEAQGQQVSTSLGTKGASVSQLVLLSFSFLVSGMGILGLASQLTILKLSFPPPFKSVYHTGYKTMSVKTLCTKTSSYQ